MPRRIIRASSYPLVSERSSCSAVIVARVSERLARLAHVRAFRLAIYSIPHRRAATLNVSSFGVAIGIFAENARKVELTFSRAEAGAFILLGQNARSICCALMDTIDVVARRKNYHGNDKRCAIFTINVNQIRWLSEGLERKFDARRIRS